MRAFSLLVVFATLAGCADHDAVPSTIPMYRVTSQFGMQASLSGTLAVVDGCLMLSGVESYLLAWPSPRTEWESTEGRVTLDGIRKRVGDFVTLEGGGGQSPPIHGDWAVPPSEDCWRPQRWIISRIIN